jgi:hypothetical protein
LPVTLPAGYDHVVDPAGDEEIARAPIQSGRGWREPAFIDDGHAATVHGNRVSSIVIHGHEWNGNLPLPELYCRIGVVQVIARSNVRVTHDPVRLISYLDGVMGRHPETRVWNLSWNETVSADPIYVSALGHDLRVLARKHNDLLVISAGNVSQTQGDRIAPPADCEAALVVGSRQFDLTGIPTTPCPVSSMKIDGARLTGICSDGKPGVCCSDQRLFGIAKNSRAMNWFILTASLTHNGQHGLPEHQTQSAVARPAALA